MIPVHSHALRPDNSNHLTRAPSDRFDNLCHDTVSHHITMLASEFSDDDKGHQVHHLKPHELFILHVSSLVAATISAISVAVASYWFFRMRRSFRHEYEPSYHLQTFADSSLAVLLCLSSRQTSSSPSGTSCT